MDLYPLPIVLISCIDTNYKLNIITVSGIGVVNTEPPLLSVAIETTRHSNKMIKKAREFVVNIPSEDLIEFVDFCGMVTGDRVNKFEASGLTPVKATHVLAPLIDECPINLECRVKSITPLNTHDLFIAEILGVHIDTALLDETGNKKIEALKPLILIFKEYWSVKKKIGEVGFSIQNS